MLAFDFHGVKKKRYPKKYLIEAISKIKETKAISTQTLPL